jgi:hypothetical protein
MQVASIFAAFRRGHWGRDRTNALVAAAIKAEPQARDGNDWSARHSSGCRANCSVPFAAAESSYQALTAAEVISRNLA